MAGGTPRTLTKRELNRALLARQFLLERARLPLPAVLERMAGLQAQYAPAMYIGLWSRVDGFRRGDLTRALERRTVVQGTLMRSTIHLVSAADYWPFAVATRSARRTLWLKWLKSLPDSSGADGLQAAASRLRARLSDGPLRRPEVAEIVGDSLVNAVGSWLDMVRVPPSGTWERRRADLYAAAEDWLGPERPVRADDAGPERRVRADDAGPERPVSADDAGPEPDGHVQPEAVEHLVRRYLGGFGPATRDEIADWAGLPPSEVGSVLERLRLRHFRAEDQRELVDLARAPLPPPDLRAPVRFLPAWDATLLVHARRTGILREEHRALVFSTKTPHSVNTFLVDGLVAGTWKHEAGRVNVEPFEPLDRSTTREVREEADRLAALFA